MVARAEGVAVIMAGELLHLFILWHWPRPGDRAVCGWQLQQPFRPSTASVPRCPDCLQVAELIDRWQPE